MYVIAQDIHAGTTFSWGRGGKKWTALADATYNGAVVTLQVAYQGTPQSMPLTIPMDRILRKY